MVLQPSHAALLFTDPQDDLGPRDATGGVMGRGVDRGTTLANIERLLEAARHANMVVAVAPHYCEPNDQRWGFGTILPECRPYFLGGRTIIATPHRVWRADDHVLAAALRQYGVAQVVLVATWANRCVESYQRGLLARDFEVAIVANATAAALTTTVWSADQAA